jgi:rifampicin phosphotransferase
MLLESEVDAFVADPASFTSTLREREVEYLTLFELDLPFIVDGGKPVPSIDSLPRRGSAHAGTAAAGDVLQGMPGCPGVARGRARVILDCSDPFALEPGDVLIAPLTDPAWTPLFVPAAAVFRAWCRALMPPNASPTAPWSKSTATPARSRFSDRASRLM